MKPKCILKALPFLLFTLGTGGTAVAQQNFIEIGTGGVTGVYYPTGGAICRLVNKDRKDHGIRCSVESTGGSVYNINTIRAGELAFGVAQSDWQYKAYNGIGRFENDGAFSELRSVFSVHPEPMTLLVARGALSDDDEWEDEDELSKIKISLRTPLADIWVTSMGLSSDVFSNRTDVSASELRDSLCNNDLDAALVTLGHPSGLIQDILSSCDVSIADCTGGSDEILSQFPFLGRSVIPVGLYPGVDRDLSTLAVGATFVTSAAVPEDVVYQVVKSVFENFDDFKSLHPAFAELSAEQMISEFNTAPLHEGAVKYYKERGWM